MSSSQCTNYKVSTSGHIVEEQVEHFKTIGNGTEQLDLNFRLTYRDRTSNQSRIQNILLQRYGHLELARNCIVDEVICAYGQVQCM